MLCVFVTMPIVVSPCVEPGRLESLMRIRGYKRENPLRRLPEGVSKSGELGARLVTLYRLSPRARSRPAAIRLNRVRRRELRGRRGA